MTLQPQQVLKHRRDCASVCMLFLFSRHIDKMLFYLGLAQAAILLTHAAENLFGVLGCQHFVVMS